MEHVCPKCNHHIPINTAVERFLARVDKLGPIPIDKPCKGNCWIWRGKTHHGYGTVSINRKNIRAHRYSFREYNGPIDDDLVVRHLCDNRRCVNPTHLTLGTRLDNVNDMVERGRSVISIASEEARHICPNCNHHILLETEEEKFWAKVDRQGPIPADKPCNNNCWTWCGQLNCNGYGCTRRMGNNSSLAHRDAWEYFNGEEIPKDLIVRHKCDNRTCVNPQHLELGTRADNHRDMMARGNPVFPIARKGPRNQEDVLMGESCPSAKLTGDQVSCIRAEYSLGKISTHELARRYGIHQSTIHAICANKTWQHIPYAVKPPSKGREKKLTEELVREIRSRHAESTSSRELSKIFGVSYDCIHDLVNRRTWKNVV